MLSCIRASTVPDAIDPAISAAEEQTATQVNTTAVEAWRCKQLTLGFSGGGFLLPYHLGVYQVQHVNLATPCCS
jgi:hypothetical protein